jgi:hypothetical protein
VGLRCREMALDIEGIEYRRVSGEKSLRRAWTLETLHLALSSLSWRMRILGAVVFPSTALVAIFDPETARSGTIRAQLGRRPCAPGLGSRPERLISHTRLTSRVGRRLDLDQAVASYAGAKSSRGGGVRLPALLLRDPLRDVARHSDRPLCDTVDRNEGEGHLDIKFEPALAQSAGQSRTSLKLQDGVCHCLIEPAPVRYAKMARNDQVETLTHRLCGAEPEQRRRGAVPSGDPSQSILHELWSGARAVGVSVRHLTRQPDAR